MHMPGHKRNPEFGGGLPVGEDITEVEGFDNLHEMTGVLGTLAGRFARLFHADRAFPDMFPDTRLVILTSPTYEGVVSDIRAIASAVHAHGATLLVDAAHGAHLGFSPDFPESPYVLGADAVVLSLHKTLPSLTQTALLLSKEQFAADIMRELAVFETSSPSYLLLASMENCAELFEKVVFNVVLKVEDKQALLETMRQKVAAISDRNEH